MSDLKPYPIAPEIFETRESELNSKLPEFYPNEAERQIAEQILVPQLRSVIAEALSNFVTSRGVLASVPPAPSELPNLCASVDKNLFDNRNLLDSEGLGKPLFEYISSVRELVKAEMVEAFKAHCRISLVTHGISDRATLLGKGTAWFGSADIHLYGKSRAFVGLILNERVKNVNLDHLCRVADILGWPELNEREKLQSYRSALFAHGITDRATFLAKGPIWFAKANFPPYGKGRAFAGLILGEWVKNMNLDYLYRVADILGWSELNERERLQAYRSALAAHGITDRSALLAKGSVWFMRADFPPYGKGRAFASLILGETVKFVILDHLGRIADILGWPKPGEQERLKGYRSALASHGISDRSALLAKGVVWFIKADFPPYGKGCAFAGLILGETVKPLFLAHLRRIADILFPESK